MRAASFHSTSFIKNYIRQRYNFIISKIRRLSIANGEHDSVFEKSEMVGELVKIKNIKEEKTNLILENNIKNRIFKKLSVFAEILLFRIDKEPPECYSNDKSA